MRDDATLLLDIHNAIEIVRRYTPADRATLDADLPIRSLLIRYLQTPAGCQMPKHSSGSLAVNDDGVRFYDPQEVMGWQFQWTEIVRISAWKDDVFTYDILCMGFLVAGSERYLHCDEECNGCDDLHPQLLRLYNINLHDWWNTVVFPAFAENFTVIWERQHG